jgi:hypothetical protein
MSTSALSHLSNGKYGYDFVVAVTQESINASMSTYLTSVPEPLIQVCYVADVDPDTDEFKPKEIEFADLLKLTDGVDPFMVDIPKKNSKQDPNFQKLLEAKFMMGF